ncbi:MAG TPA: kynureninase, partial [Bacteroidetes bacterium]|nr:kynureninase [Bacteroidota bacterium]
MTKTEAHSYAAQMDAKDTLGVFRNRFHIPLHHGEPVAYFCGNSLGLVPRATADVVQDELEDWKNLGVEGHFHARKPWFSYHRLLTDSLARLTGAKPHEVVAMNSLTANLHLLMTSLYRPTADRYRIVIAGNEFPSDRYAVESQVRLHGHDPEQAMIEVAPDPGTYEISTQRLEEAIAQHGESVALVLISGVHFFTGQFFDI